MEFTDVLGAHAARPAVIDARGTSTHADLAHAAKRVASALVDGRGDLAEARVALLMTSGVEFAAALAGTWLAGGVAVPLAVTDPAAELDYLLRDAAADVLIAGPSFVHTAAPLAADAGVRLRTTLEVMSAALSDLPVIASDRRALIVYSSGTTAKPKGVVTTHANVTAQVSSLLTAWEWTPEDRTLLVLPLHHVHGLVNVLTSAMWAGAACEMLPRFDAETTWARLGSGEISVFTAVPTIYQRLIACWESASDERRLAWSAGARRARLMMCGSAALPLHVLQRWEEITGHVLLERYGMTELGMALGNPLHGVRRPGFVGTPLPGVDVRLVDEQGSEVGADMPGEIEARGPNVFLEYWRRPDVTRVAFRDGWFRTGDVAVMTDGAYRLLGRMSVDIIKTGGYKVSALEIEDALRAHPAVVDCAVIGVADSVWGERVCAAVELLPSTGLTLDELQAFVKARLSPHKVPKDLRAVPALPRNAMGKVVKPRVSEWFASH